MNNFEKIPTTAPTPEKKDNVAEEEKKEKIVENTTEDKLDKVESDSSSDLEEEINREIVGNVEKNKEILSKISKEEPEDIEIKNENLEDIEKKVREIVKKEFEAAGLSIESSDKKSEHEYNKTLDFEQVVAQRTIIEADKKRVSMLSAEDLKKENAEIENRKNKLLALIEQRKSKEEVKRLEDSYYNDNSNEFSAKNILIPSFLNWTKRREKSGKDVDILEFIKEEDISKIELDILVKEFSRYDSKELPITLSRTAMLRKNKISSELRENTHDVLRQVGSLDADVEGLQMRKFKVRYDKWVNEFIERLGVTVELWSHGMMPLSFIFTKFWDGQGKIERAAAKLNKKRMGEVAHVFTLREVARKMDEVVSLIDQSDNAKEIQFYNKELKNYTRLLVEWGNEYDRLHSGDSSTPFIDSENMNVNLSYKEIAKKTDELSEVMIAEIYPESEQDKKIVMTEDKEREIEKKEFSSNMINTINTKISEINNRLDKNPKEYADALNKIAGHDSIEDIMADQPLYEYRSSLLKPTNQNLLDAIEYHDKFKARDEDQKKAYQELSEVISKIYKNTNKEEVLNLISDAQIIIAKNGLDDVGVGGLNKFFDESIT